MNQVVYLDNNATTIIRPEVVAAMSECMAQGYANPASQHAEGRRARNALEAARDGIGRILGARQDTVQSDRVIFTSGGTESNNLALRGRWNQKSTQADDTNPSQRFVVSTIEHPSVIDAAKHLAIEGADICWLPVDANGVVDLDSLEDLLTDETGLVTVMMANNETGVMQPIDSIVEVCRSFGDHGIPVHTDAVQVAGKLPLSFEELGVASMTVTAHKFHGPRGIGALLVRYDHQIQPTTFGGSQQLGTRPGTESVVLAVGMHKALELWEQESEQRRTSMVRLRDRFETAIRQAVPEVVINGQHAERLPHTSNVSFPGLDRQALLLALDRAGIACSTGSACTSGSSEPSHVLIAMGCSKEIIEGSLRISFAGTTTAKEVDWAVKKIAEISRKISAF